MATPHIGTLREKPLHAALKRWYAQPGDRIEEPIGGFVVDLVRDDVMVEIQTRGFSSMKAKVVEMLGQGHGVRIVHPVAVDRWLVKVDDAGAVLDRRRSPKHGDVIDVFAELVSFPELLAHPGFEVDVVLTVQEEIRRHRPGKAWRRKGWVVAERRLLEVVDSVRLATVRDAISMLPGGLPEPFTTADLATGLGRPRRLAQQMAYCLRETGGIVISGKVGNALTYRVA